MRRAALPSTAFVLSLVGCGLTADFSGLQGGTRPDAAAEAAAPADAGPGFCASLMAPVKLCSDFDEGAAIDKGWGATDVYGGEAIRVDKSVSLSPPGSFFSAINPSGAPASARLLQSVPLDAPRVHVEFAMLLTPSDGTLELCVLHEVTGGGVTYGIYYQEVGRKLELQVRSLAGDGSMFVQSWPIGDPPPSWTRVAIDVEVGDLGSFTVKHDGRTVASATGVPTVTPSRTAMFVELGFYSYVPASGQANFDDAVVDWP